MTCERKAPLAGPRARRASNRIVAGRPLRRGFTLVELLMVISVLMLLSSTVLFALWGAQNDAKEARTRAIVKKIDSLLQQRWQEFQVRSLRRPMDPSLSNPNTLAQWRVLAIRDLMRMELPERMEDVLLPSPLAPALRPLSALWQDYQRQATATWTPEFQGAECLYLIIANMRDGDVGGLQFFNESELGDVDGDGMREILDGWGNPVSFLRWAPGFLSDWPEDMSGNTVFSPNSPPPFRMATMQTAQRANPTDPNRAAPNTFGDFSTPPAAPDPFDPLRVDARWSGNAIFHPYALYPLVYSAGRDGVYGIAQVPPAPFTGTASIDPYLRLDSLFTLGPSDPVLFGTPGTGAGDNITNHYTEVR